MMKHSQLFIDSLIHPKKLAAYRLLSIGKTIQYVFILIGIVTTYSYIEYLLNVSESSFNMIGLPEYIEDIKWLLYPFAFLFLAFTSTILIFVKISIYSFIGIILLKLLSRRGEYRHMWRTTALTITWSTLLSIPLSLIGLQDHLLANLVMIIITIFILILASTNYPKLQKK